jgi:hypothetical protein
MKYVFIFLLSLVWFVEIHAQGNLQFNQVKIISNIDPPQTVPAGKVWKIESVFTAGDQDVYGVQTSGTNDKFTDMGTCWVHHLHLYQFWYLCARLLGH